MRFVPTCVAAGAALLSGSLLAAAPNQSAETRKAIQARYDGYLADLKSMVAAKDPTQYKSIVEKYTAPNFEWHGFNKRDRSGLTSTIQFWTEFYKWSRSIDEAHTRILSFRQRGRNQAVAVSATSTRQTLVDSHGNVHHLVSVGSSRDGWVIRNGTWVVRTMQALSDRTVLDGKPFKGDVIGFLAKK